MGLPLWRLRAPTGPITVSLAALPRVTAQPDGQLILAAPRPAVPLLSSRTTARSRERVGAFLLERIQPFSLHLRAELAIVGRL